MIDEGIEKSSPWKEKLLKNILIISSQKKFDIPFNRQQLADYLNNDPYIIIPLM